MAGLRCIDWVKHIATPLTASSASMASEAMLVCVQPEGNVSVT